MMIALAWSFFVVLSMVVASSQAFHAGPLTGLDSSLSTPTTASPTTAPSKTVAMAGKLDEKPMLKKNPTIVDMLKAAAAMEDELEAEEEATEEEDYDAQPAKPPRRGDEQIYVIDFENEAEGAKGQGSRNRASKHGLNDDGSEGQSPLDPWSIVWYIGSFGGLVAFFLIVSCSEWCCRRGARPMSVPYAQRAEVMGGSGQPVSESPPPPYHLFAPPPYDSVNYADIADKSAAAAAEKLDIYVITLPIHQPSLPGQQQLQPPAAQPPA